MDAVLRQIDSELAAASDDGPFFLGEELSLVDCMFTPFLERMAASLPYFKGFEVRGEKYPHLERWFLAMDSRESYQGLKSDYYTHCHDLPPQIGACYFLPDAAPFTAEIDGGSWVLDFGQGIEPLTPADEGVARREAVRSFLHNFEAVVRFSARGAGSKGVPRVSAPLADPNARGSEEIIPAVSLALRLVLHCMLETEIAKGISHEAVRELGLPAVTSDCLRYLRDRVGVPRDMSVHAARQLRAHLNLLIDNISVA
jgi:glutathione S-transferase